MALRKSLLKTGVSAMGLMVMVGCGPQEPPAIPAPQPTPSLIPTPMLSPISPLPPPTQPAPLPSIPPGATASPAPTPSPVETYLPITIITGQVLRKSGEAVARAVITAESADLIPNPFKARTSTDSSGQFMLQQIPVGHKILVYARTFEGDERLGNVTAERSMVVSAHGDSRFNHYDFIFEALPTPTPTDIPQHTVFIQGKVFEDTEIPLNDVAIKVKSFTSGLPFEATTTTFDGAYRINGVPYGIAIEIMASKPGFATRRRIEVPKDRGFPYENGYDFGPGQGSNGSLNNALSDKPEVTTVTPGRFASGVAPNTKFVLKFSEPMDRATVVDNFIIRAFTTHTLTVDTGTVVANNPTFAGASDFRLENVNGFPIWDKEAFLITWNEEDSEATFSFKEGKQLPSDKDGDRIPDYQVSFSALVPHGLLKDKIGISRDKDYFKLTEGDFEHSYKFAITRDTKRPEVFSITAQTNENQDTNGEAIKVIYSEPMIIYTKSRAVAGGLEDRTGVLGSEAEAPAGHPANQGNATALNAAGNYTVKIAPGPGSLTPATETTWKALGGSAFYDPSDPTNRTVLLLPPTPTTNLFAPGDTVQVTVASTVLDPAGNIMDSDKRSKMLVLP